MSDTEELIDPKKVAEAACHEPCLKPFNIYQECAKRVAGVEGKHCTGYYMDYWKCVDHCATPKYFHKLK
jgi:ubiquinol-cytochrome c reductase subunit 6